MPTVCTSDLGDDARSIATRCSGRVAKPARLAADRRGPRASLDDAGWIELRHSCPPRLGDRPIDLAVAERLLADPVLYSQAVHA